MTLTIQLTEAMDALRMQKIPKPGVKPVRALPLPTRALGSYHVLVLFVDDGAVGLDGEHAQGAVLGGDAGGLGDRGVQSLVDEVLDHGVHGGAVTMPHDPGAVAFAVLGAVPVRCDYPSVPFQLAKAQAEVVKLTLVLREQELFEILAEIIRWSCRCFFQILVSSLSRGPFTL